MPHSKNSWIRQEPFYLRVTGVRTEAPGCICGICALVVYVEAVGGASSLARRKCHAVHGPLVYPHSSMTSVGVHADADTHLDSTRC